MKIKEVIKVIEEFAPPALQENYDNAGLIVGNREAELRKTLISVDVTEQVVDEAISKDANLIVAHHPIIFAGLKKITGKNFVERIVIKAIKNDIAIYAAHTNVDNVQNGVNKKIAEKLQLKDTKVLKPMQNQLRKLVTFVPNEHATTVRNAIFEAGAGKIGNYDGCSYNLEGNGSFRASDKANPFVGKVGKLHFEPEVRIETIYPKYKERTVLNAMFDAHPYEEVAYDIYPLENSFDLAGAGIVGYLQEETNVVDFLKTLKSIFNTGVIRYTTPPRKSIRKIAVCGGAGSFLLQNAIAAQADIFVSADFKYHEFFTAENRITIADIGHYESEQFTKEIFYDILTKKIINFAGYLCETSTNPIKYI